MHWRLALRPRPRWEAHDALPDPQSPGGHVPSPASPPLRLEVAVPPELGCCLRPCAIMTLTNLRSLRWCSRLEMHSSVLHLWAFNRQDCNVFHVLCTVAHGRITAFDERDVFSWTKLKAQLFHMNWETTICIIHFPTQMHAIGQIIRPIAHVWTRLHCTTQEYDVTEPCLICS
jgi:hypothetical protein